LNLCYLLEEHDTQPFRHSDCRKGIDPSTYCVLSDSPR